jgi:methylmalonyl-CoA mutase
MELAGAGIEVVYLGYHQAASAIARAAVQEDVQAIGLSSYNGGHLVFFREVMKHLRRRGAADLALFGGGGGTITPADERAMLRAGVDKIFSAGTPLAEIVRTIQERYARPRSRSRRDRGDRALARAITALESRGAGQPKFALRNPAEIRPGMVIGIAGPGGAGKSTLIDELTARFLRANRSGRIAILANDPSHPESGGAVLGDRVSALYAQDDRVFFRSLATRGSLTGLSAATPPAIDLLRCSGEFDLIFVESVGIGQEGDPFGLFTQHRLVDLSLFVLSPHYGGRIQLQKIAMLNGADIVVLNKCDDPRAAAARSELQARLGANARPASLHATVAARHADPGVDLLFATIAELAEGERPGGEKPCLLER